MAMEDETYRDNLAALVDVFPDRRALNVTDLSRYLGISYNAAKQWWIKKGIKDQFATRETIARLLS